MISPESYTYFRQFPWTSTGYQKEEDIGQIQEERVRAQPAPPQFKVRSNFLLPGSSGKQLGESAHPTGMNLFSLFLTSFP